MEVCLLRIIFSRLSIILPQPVLTFALGILVCSHSQGPYLRFKWLYYLPEDAPAQAALQSFKTHVSDGKIYVTADPLKVDSSRPPKLNISGTDTGKGVLIVGGGAGAYHTVESLRQVRCMLWLCMRP
jgi:hypothetical protein